MMFFLSGLFVGAVAQYLTARVLHRAEPPKRNTISDTWVVTRGKRRAGLYEEKRVCYVVTDGETEYVMKGELEPESERKAHEVATRLNRAVAEYPDVNDVVARQAALKEAKSQFDRELSS